MHIKTKEKKNYKTQVKPNVSSIIIYFIDQHIHSAETFISNNFKRAIKQNYDKYFSEENSNNKIEIEIYYFSKTKNT